MNCYNHPDTAIVATCVDCNKGLCKHCSDVFSLPICETCNQIRIAGERRKIFIELGWMIALPIIVLVILMNTSAGIALKGKPLSIIVWFYILMAIVAGWSSLSKITANYFLFLSYFGWLIYFLYKFILSAVVGIFIAPFRLFKNIKRLRELHQIQAIKS